MINDNNNFVNQSVLWGGDQNEVVFDVPTFPDSMMKTTTTTTFAAAADQNQILEEEEKEEVIMSQKIWLEKQQQQQSHHQDHTHLLDLSKASSYYVDDFSPLPLLLPLPAAPDFTTTNCMPSFSSFPPPPPPPLAVKTTTVSSSSTSSDACWPVLITTPNNSDLQKMQLTPPAAADAANYYETTSKSKSKSNNNNNNNNNVAAAVVVPLLQPESSSSSSTTRGRGRGNNINCLNVMEDFNFMDVMDQIDFWDPSSSSSSSIFQSEQQVLNQEQMRKSVVVVAEQDSNQQQQKIMQQEPIIPDDEEEESSSSGGGGFTGLSYFLQGDKELSALFMEWVMQHKDSINSSDDIINMKLKRSTIDKASKRLGNTNQGKKQLFKLILQWVEHNFLVFHNNKKRTLNPPPPPPYLLHQNPNSNPGSGQSPNLYCNSIPLLDANNNNNCFTASTYNWIQPPTPYAAAAAAYQTPAVVPYAANQSAYPPYQIPSSIGYVYDPYCSWNKIVNANNNRVIPSSSSIVESPLHMETWSGPSQSHSQQVVNSFWVNNTSKSSVVAPEGLNPIREHQVVIRSGGGNNSSSSNAAYHLQVFDENVERRRRLLKLGPLATKEARKKRMARHKRQHHIPSISNNHQNQVDVDENQQSNYELLLLQNYNSQAAAAPPPPPPPPNLVYNWPQTHPTSAEVHPPAPQVNTKKKEEENNLQFLLQKVLKQSDVGNLGRIVLPKKEAEMHLPELKSRDGIPITIQDIATSNVWTMRYRFWPNNNSRMYLFENTGEFVRANGLQQGDFIVLYSDTKSGKYLIRGIKVRPSETRPAAPVVNKKATKKGRNNATPGRSKLLREIMM